MYIVSSAQVCSPLSAIQKTVNLAGEYRHGASVGTINHVRQRTGKDSRRGLEAWPRGVATTGGRRRNLPRAIMTPQNVHMEDVASAVQILEEMISTYSKKVESMVSDA